MNITFTPARIEPILKAILLVVIAFHFGIAVASEASQRKSVTQDQGDVATNSVPNMVATVIETEDKYSVPGLNFLFKKLPAPWIAIQPEIDDDSSPPVLFFENTETKARLSVMAGNSARPETTPHMLARLLFPLYDEERRKDKYSNFGSMASLDFTTITDKTAAVGRIAVRNGYYYGLLYTTESLNRSGLANEADALFKNLSQFDPFSVSEIYPIKSSSKFSSQNYPYRIDFGEGPWRRYVPEKSANTYAEYMAMIPGLDVWISLWPIALNGTNPDITTLASVFLQFMNIESQKVRLSEAKPIYRNGYEVIEFDYTRTENGRPLPTRFQVLKGNDSAFFLIAGVPQALSYRRDEFFSKLNKFQFSEKTKPARQISNFEKEESIRQGTFFRQLASHYLDTQKLDLALDYFRIAHEFNPGDELIVRGILSTYNRLGRFSIGLDFANRALSIFPRSYEVLSYKAFFQGKLGQISEAIDTYRESFALDRRDENDFFEYINLLWDAGQRDSAVTESTAYITTTDSLEARRLLGNLYLRDGKPELAKPVFAEIRLRAPTDLDAAYGLIESNFRLEHQHEALAICDRLTATGNESAINQFYRGRSELALKWYIQAKTSFEKSLHLNPTDTTVKEYLAHVSAILGEGNNSNIKNPIDPVELPPISDFADIQPPSSDTEAVFLLRARGFHYKPGQDRRQTDYYRVKILGNLGIESFSTFQIPFNPQREQIFVNSLKVSDSQDVLTATGDISSFYVIDDTSNGMASDDKILNIPVPNVSVGSTVDLVITRRSFGKSSRFRYVESAFFTRYPVLRSTLYVSGTYQTLHWTMPKGAVEQKWADGILWSMGNVAPYVSEPSQADPKTFMPYGRIGDSGTTWGELAHQYSLDLSDRLAVTDVARQLAEKIAGGEGTVSGKVKAITRYVQSELTYKAIEFGARGTIPNNVKDIIRNRYGDCKDHSLLLHQLLSASGIESRLALANSSTVIDDAFPSLDQFDHMVVYCPGCGNKMIIDATDKDLDQFDSAPRGLAHKKVLILDESQSQLFEIQGYKESDNFVRSDRTIVVRPDGTMAIHEIASFGGAVAASQRAAMKEADAKGRHEIIQRVFKSVDNGLVLLKLEVKNLLDLTKPLVIEADYSPSTQFLGSQNRLAGKIPALLEYYILWSEPSPNRVTPFEIRYPIVLTGTVRFRTPEILHIAEETKAHKATTHGKYLHWNGQISKDIRSAELNYEVKFIPGRFPADNYAEYVRELDAAKALVSPTVHLKTAAMPGH